MGEETLKFIAAIDVIVVGAMAIFLLLQQREIGDLKERIARLETSTPVTVNIEEAPANQ